MGRDREAEGSTCQRQGEWERRKRWERLQGKSGAKVPPYRPSGKELPAPDWAPHGISPSVSSQRPGPLGPQAG